MSISELELMSTMICGPDVFQKINQRESRLNRLPCNEGRHCDKECRKIAEQLGFVFGKNIDDLWVEVKAPPGWDLQYTDHAMWSNIVDDKGRVRAQQFYKAAFYDRDAFYSWRTRYHVDIDRPENWFELTHPTQPDPIYETKRRKVRITKEEYVKNWRANRYYDTFNDSLYQDFWEDDFDFGCRMMDVQVLAKKQPKPVASQSYWASAGIRDRSTGQYIRISDMFEVLPRDHPDYRCGHGREDAARQIAAQVLDQILPKCLDPAAYW